MGKVHRLSGSGLIFSLRYSRVLEEIPEESPDNKNRSVGEPAEGSLKRF